MLNYWILFKCNTTTTAAILRPFVSTRRDIHTLTPEIIDFGGRWSVIIIDFKRRGEDNRGKFANNPAVCHPIWTIDALISIIFPVLHRMPFLPQPSQFILAWDRHQICWIAYLEAWCRCNKQCSSCIADYVKYLNLAVCFLWYSGKSWFCTVLWLSFFVPYSLCCTCTSGAKVAGKQRI